ncbi:MAG: extracellular solute-binding protein [Kiritimatiellae bacterium]|nr:extracellular solute-binding protein [Kiritimatiellia bacterium]
MKRTGGALLARTVSRLVDELAGGTYTVGQPLPTQGEWAAQLGVSTYTVSRAFQILQGKGVVSSFRGSCTRLLAVPSRTLLHEEQGKRVRLTLWSRDPLGLQHISALVREGQWIDAFAREYPFIDLDRHAMMMSTVEFDSRALRAVMSGPEPTFWLTNATCLPLMRTGNMLAPVNMAVCVSWFDALDPEVVGVCSCDGVPCLFPEFVTHSPLIYNRRLLTEAGFDADRPPANWDEFRDAARRLSAGRGGKPSLYVEGTYNLIHFLLHLVYQAAPAIDPAGLAPIAWTSKEAELAAGYFATLRNDGLVALAPKNGSLARRFVNGGVPMVFGYTHTCLRAAAKVGLAAEFGLCVLPAGPSGRFVSLANIGGWVVNPHASPAQQEAAWRCIDFRVRWMRDVPEPHRHGPFFSALPTFGLFKHGPTAADEASDLPAWRAGMEQAREHRCWEPPAAHWNKLALAACARDWFPADTPLSAERVLRDIRVSLLDDLFAPPT